MDRTRDNAAVEKRLKDALRHDRARIQVGRISHFGLLELSRQRLRPSLNETAFVSCPHCLGRGTVRSLESSAIAVLRAVEEECARRRAAEITVKVNTPVALYLLNKKRERLNDIEGRWGVCVLFEPDDALHGAETRIERSRTAPPPVAEERPAAIRMDYAEEEEAIAAASADARRGRRGRAPGGDARRGRGAAGAPPPPPRARQGPPRGGRRGATGRRGGR
jgi:ribonuclease E